MNTALSVTAKARIGLKQRRLGQQLGYPIFARCVSAARNGTNPNLHFPCVERNEDRLERQLGTGREKKSEHAVTGPHGLQDRHVPTPPESGSERLAFVDPKLAAAASTPRPDLRIGDKGSTVENGHSSKRQEGGPEPAYSKVVTGYQTFGYEHNFLCDHGGLLPRLDIAYEAWGTLNADRSNVILLHTGLSASSHAKSHERNASEGWWEKFIGPGLALDTDKFYIVCTNVLGGCYGSTGPYSIDPSDQLPYATRFPIITIWDMVRAQFLLLDHLMVDKLYASVGSSMGGMQSLAAASMYPDRVGKIITISGCARSHPYSIALRHTQRSILMSDPAWKRGHYYASDPPHVGMKLARQLATITYRSGPEWEQRFGRKRVASIDDTQPSLSSLPVPGEEREENPPSLCPDFLIETYLDHQGERFCLQYDANSLIYISKAMDLFDMSASAIKRLAKERERHSTSYLDEGRGDAEASLPVEVILPSDNLSLERTENANRRPILTVSPTTSSLTDLARGLENLGNHSTLVLGCQSDILFPCWQQREIAECLRINGNREVVYYELDSLYGHDTFLIDYTNVGRAVKGFLELR